MRNILIFIACLACCSMAYAQNSGYFFTVQGDFDGDDEEEMIREYFTDEYQQSIDKNYSLENINLDKVITCSFSSKETNIPSFEASIGSNHAGFALLHTLGDLDNDGGEEVGYVMHWLDQSNLNTYHIISLKNGVWTELYQMPIRDDQLPLLPQINYHHTDFGNTSSYDTQINSAEEMDELLKREKELNEFEGFVKKLSLFNILVRFVNDSGLEAYALWNLKSGETKAISNLPLEEDFLIIGEGVQIPSFTLDLQASEEVQQLLQNKKEEIILSIDVYGTPIKNLDYEAEKYLDDYGANLFIGKFEFKLDKAETLVFEGQTIPQIAFENLKNPNFMVSINVSSSRKSSERNVFDASYLGDEIFNLKNKTHQITIDILK